MRIALPCSLFLVSVLGCGRAELLEPPAVEQPAVVEQPPVVPRPAATRFRLRSTSYERNDGFRFSDSAILTAHTYFVGQVRGTEVRTSDGTLVEGDAARVDLQTSSPAARSIPGRLFTLDSKNGQFCVTKRPVTSLAEVSAADCQEWKSGKSFFPPEPMDAQGLVVQTGRNTAYRVRILESGFVESTASDDMLFEFEPYPALAQCVMGTGCVVSADCCNRRHTCSSGTCDY